jgi:hypothetical protein
MNFNIRKTNKQEENKNKSKKISKNLSECLSSKKPERKKGLIEQIIIIKNKKY